MQTHRNIDVKKMIIIFFTSCYVIYVFKNLTF
ncbi:MAG: hypothetical protein ACI8P3_002287 [Saprospiraceae bacterium]|jgi:hypothetical protein